MTAPGKAFALAMFVSALILVGCNAIPFVPPPFGGGGPAATPTGVQGLSYSAPVTLSIKNGAVLPGTNIGYGGKTPTGAARLLLGGVAAPKQTGDSVDWKGMPAPGTDVQLALRVGPFDEQSVTLVGTAQIQFPSFVTQPGPFVTAAPLDFNAPVTFSVAKNSAIPGTNIVYVGSTAQGAQFSGLEGFAYRKPLDSLQYVGRLAPKTFLRLDLRIVNFSEKEVILAGTANIKIEPQ